MKESGGWTSSRLTMRLLNLKRPQLNKVVQVLTGHYNLQQDKKTTGLAKSSLCSKCSLEDETPNHHVGNCKLYQDICVKYFGITKATVHNVVTSGGQITRAWYGMEWKTIFLYSIPEIFFHSISISC